MITKYNFTFRPSRALSMVLLFLLPLCLPAQKRAKHQNVEVTIEVVDENGTAIPGASVIIGEGLIHATTDMNGKYSFKGRPSTSVAVSMVGYDKFSSFIAPLVNDGRIVMKEAAYLKSSDDIVNVPFSSTYKRYTTDNLSTLTSEDVSKYPTSDLRNAMVGLMPGYISTEKDGQPGLTSEETNGRFGIVEKVSEISRGQSIVYVVDDIELDIAEMPLDPEEIESVTLVKDPVTKSLYGPAAANGVVYIKTKRGRINDRKISVNMEAGVSVIDRFPEYTNGVDYAKLNNQARLGSGLKPLYDDSAIAEYAKNDPYSMLFPNVNFRKMTLNNTRSYQRANVSSIGGNQKVQYSAYIGYTGEGDIYKIGSKADYNRLNVRTNLDVKLSDVIKLRFDFAGGLNIRRSPKYGSSERINEFPALINHVNNISPIAFPVYVGVSEETGGHIYGLSKIFGENPIGGLEGNGEFTEMNRIGIGNVSLDIDLNHLIKGLKSTTYIGFDGNYLTRNGKKEQYAASFWWPDENKDEGYGLEKARDEAKVPGKSKLHYYFSVRYTAYEKLSYDRIFNKHKVKADLLMYMNHLTRKGFPEPILQANGIFNAEYVYNDKYIFQGTLNYAGSNYYANKNRYKIFPTFGAAWVVSDEKFMKDINFIDFLKLRAQIGRLGSFTYKNRGNFNSNWSSQNTGAFGYVGGTATDWLGGKNLSTLTSTTCTTLGNPNLDWEYWDEFTTGFEMLLFKHKLALDFSYYNRTKSGIIDQISNYYPSYMGMHVLPFVNYAKTRFQGIEIMLSYKDRIGDLKYKLGFNASHDKAKLIITDEPNYPDREKWYRQKAGHSPNDIYGLDCIGRYATDEEAANDPVKSTFSNELKAGDLRYRDMNGDGIINNNDVTRIGNGQAKLYYAFNIDLEYKGIELSAVGTGLAGRKGLLPSSYYRGGSGDNNYSAWVKDNIGGAYPRLTYYKVDHNFQNSNFWLRNTSYFKLQNVEIAYNFPSKICNNLGVQGLKVFARGANLFTLSKIKYTDPESMESGISAYPLNTTYVGGLKLVF